MNTQDKCSDSWGRIQPERRRGRDAEVHRLAAPKVRQIRKELAAWIARARSKAGLGRREVAARMGYNKLERGMSSLARWERGEEAVWGDRIPVLARALEAPVKELAAFSRQELAAESAAEEEVAKRADANAAANESELSLLARYASELSEPGPIADRLRARSDVLLRSAGWSVALLGGGHFSLHFLMHTWSRGHLTAPCDCCDGTLLLTWVAGSPFSGSHRMRGICRTTRAVRSFKFNDPAEASKLLSHTTQIVRQAQSSVRHDLTLGEVLSRAGLEVPLVRIRDPEGAPLAVFDPASGVINPTAGHARVGHGVETPVGLDLRVTKRRGPAREGGRVETPVGLDLRVTKRRGLAKEGGRVETPVGLDLRVTKRRGPAREGGRIVIRGLSPLSFGAWQGESIELVAPGGGVWRLHPGYLEDPAQRVAAWFDAPVPPVVAAWLAGRR